ncbi:hypothetical protein DMH08_37440 [Actinomadura sp. WAC 06369]|nr:hypothetical protein DMH08_37440 [Actinomadura sp. WAC 06369]
MTGTGQVLDTPLTRLTGVRHPVVQTARGGWAGRRVRGALVGGRTVGVEGRVPAAHGSPLPGAGRVGWERAHGHSIDARAGSGVLPFSSP